MSRSRAAWGATGSEVDPRNMWKDFGQITMTVPNIEMNQLCEIAVHEKVHALGMSSGTESIHAFMIATFMFQ